MISMRHSRFLLKLARVSCNCLNFPVVDVTFIIYFNRFFPQAAILSSPHGKRALSPGRIVTINTAEHKNALAIILQAENTSTHGYSTMQLQSASSPKEKKFQVLVICDAEEQAHGK